jgi:hypothetical protein
MISTLIILSLIFIPVIWGFYFTDWKNEQLFSAGEWRQAIPEFQENSRAFGQRILLRKNKAFTVNKSRLVFRGVADEKIHLDVYLLELDPETAYAHYISTASSSGRFRLGDNQFQLLKVSRGVVQLKILDLFHS